MIYEDYPVEPQYMGRINSYSFPSLPGRSQSSRRPRSCLGALMFTVHSDQDADSCPGCDQTMRKCPGQWAVL